MAQGWWKLSIEMWSYDKKGNSVAELPEPDESTLEHIAELIKEGYTQGQIIQETDEEEED